jgi:hypothetical protein
LDAGFAALAGLSAVLAAGALAAVPSAFAGALAAVFSAFAGALAAVFSAFAGTLAFAALEENLPRTIACAASSIPLEADFTG